MATKKATGVNVTLLPCHERDEATTTTTVCDGWVKVQKTGKEFAIKQAIMFEIHHTDQHQQMDSVNMLYLP